MDTEVQVHEQSLVEVQVQAEGEAGVQGEMQLMESSQKTNLEPAWVQTSASFCFYWGCNRTIT